MTTTTENRRPLRQGRRRHRHPDPGRSPPVGQHDERALPLLDARRRREAVRRDRRRPRRRDRRGGRQRQEDLLRRWRPQGHGQDGQGRRRGRLRDVGDHQGLPASPRALPEAGGRRDQRRGARRRVRDLPGHQPPHRRRRPQGQHRAARGEPGAAARRWRCHPDRAQVRPAGRAHGVPAHRRPVQGGGGQGEGAGRRAGRDPGGARAGREGLDQGQPRRDAEPVGRSRLQDARRQPEVAGTGGVPAGVPRPAASADQGCGLPGRPGDPQRRGRGRQP